MGTFTMNNDYMNVIYLEGHCSLKDKQVSIK